MLWGETRGLSANASLVAEYRSSMFASSVFEDDESIWIFGYTDKLISITWNDSLTLAHLSNYGGFILNWK